MRRNYVDNFDFKKKLPPIAANSYTKRLPKAGETILGTKFAQNFGGKGANQCVAANRLGATTAMVGRVGDDSFGQSYYDYLKSLPRMNVEFLARQVDSANGVAPIWVDENTGENYIIIIPGANAHLSVDDVRRAEITIIRPATVLATQLEVPMETTLEALRVARKHGVLTIFNPAPYTEQLDEEIYRHCDIVCPNEVECEQMTGFKIAGEDGDGPVSTENAEKAAQYFFQRGCRCLIVTVGKRGCMYRLQSEKNCVVVPIIDKVAQVVDSTGAGDAFVGSLAFFLAGKLNKRIKIHKGDKCGGNDAGDMLSGELVKEAVEFAGKIASLSVQKAGTQPSYPRSEQLPNDLKKIVDQVKELLH